MIRTLLCVLGLSAALALPGAATAQQTPFAPVAVVNDDAITGFDLEQRIRMLQVLADGGEASQLQSVALDQLIEDRLKLQAGERLGLDPTDEMIGEGLQRFAEQRGTTVEALSNRMQAAGISPLAMKDLISAEVIWFEVVRGRFLSRVEPSEGEIDAEIGLIGSGAPATAYRLQEIGLPIPQGQEAAAEARARQVYDQLSAGGDFDAAVRQYSQAPSAKEGGVVGWVDGNRLPAELSATLASLQPGQITPPLRVAAGYSIVKLLEVRREDQPAVAEVSPEVRDEVRRRMIEQRIGRLAEGMLQELRRDALIEVR